VGNIVVFGIHKPEARRMYVLLHSAAASVKSSHKERCLTTN
jgi:hypothetical protein